MLNSSVSLGANRFCKKNVVGIGIPNYTLQWKPIILLSFDYLRVKQKSPFINSGDITDQTILADSILNYYNLIINLLPEIGLAQENFFFLEK